MLSKTRSPIQENSNDRNAQGFRVLLLGKRAKVRFLLSCLGSGLLAISTLTAQSQFQGSVSTDAPSAAPITLSLREAITRGLRTNLGLLVSISESEVTRGARLRALSALLPSLDANAGETVEQSNLQAVGINVPTIPTIVGPFHYTDVRGYMSWNVFDYSARKNYRATQENRRAAQLAVSDARDLVVQAVASAYLQITTDASRVEATRSQVTTSIALYTRAEDQRQAGTAAKIDVLRAQVEIKQQQQRLLAQDNQLAKDKLVLARIIGLPDGQEFNLAESVPFAVLRPMTLDEAFAAASRKRADLQSYQARVRAADEALKAARAERYPTADISANYGDIGTSLANSHGTFTVTASAKVNLFNGGRIAGDIVQAQAQLKERQDELADLTGQIKQQIRSAFLDITSAADQVAVARDNLDLPSQTLVQSRDRFAAGMTDNIEVVQAQEAVASASDQLISALYAHNFAKVALARSLGGAEQGIQQMLELK